MVDENGDFQTITNASVPITCCKLDKKNTNYPKKVEYKDVTQCLTTADEEYTNHEVLHDCNISLVRAASDPRCYIGYCGVISKWSFCCRAATSR